MFSVDLYLRIHTYVRKFLVSFLRMSGFSIWKDLKNERKQTILNEKSQNRKPKYSAWIYFCELAKMKHFVRIYFCEFNQNSQNSRKFIHAKIYHNKVVAYLEIVLYIGREIAFTFFNPLMEYNFASLYTYVFQ